MPVHRVIYRLDFRRPSFQIIDSPGTVMRILSEMGDEKYWPEFKDSIANRVISVSAHDEKNGVFRQFGVEPTAMNFLVDFSSGLGLRSVLANDEVASLFKGINTFCEHFKINDFSRAGLRLISLDTIKTNDSSLLPKVTSLIDKEILDNVKSTIGNITDLGIALDGEDADKLAYHLRFGPYVPSEAKKYFSAEMVKAIETSQDAANFVTDLDFYESNFVMAVRASQWSKVPIDKAQKLMAMMPKLLTNGG